MISKIRSSLIRYTLLSLYFLSFYIYSILKNNNYGNGLLKNSNSESDISFFEKRLTP